MIPFSSNDAIGQPATVLCVDDEPNILSSLRRVFHAQGYRIRTAESAEAGLEILSSEPVNLVISDMRMPGMDGAQFLERVRIQWPDTVRLLLTGHADVHSIMAAINRGEIHRYITKPWSDHDIIIIVRQALERQAVEQEKRRLEAVVHRQNSELKALNAELEQKVEARTWELKQALGKLAVSNDKLKTNFITSLKMFSSLIEMRAGNLAGHARQVADLARRIALAAGLNAGDVQDVFIAGLLHSIGKVGFADELLSKPLSVMNGAELGQYRKYPQRGEELLMPLEELRNAAAIIRSHQERFDGEGYPDRLSGFTIPLGARILAVACDYYNLQAGIITQRRLAHEEAAAFIAENRGTRYDPSVVKAFQSLGESQGMAEAMLVEAVEAKNLKPGMVIARDLMSADGFLLLSADHVLNERQVAQIMEYARSAKQPFTAYIRAFAAKP